MRSAGAQGVARETPEATGRAAACGARGGSECTLKSLRPVTRAPQEGIDIWPRLLTMRGRSDAQGETSQGSTLGVTWRSGARCCLTRARSRRAVRARGAARAAPSDECR